MHLASPPRYLTFLSCLSTLTFVDFCRRDVTLSSPGFRCFSAFPHQRHVLPLWVCSVEHLHLPLSPLYFSREYFKNRQARYLSRARPLDFFPPASVRFSKSTFSSLHVSASAISYKHLSRPPRFPSSAFFQIFFLLTSVSFSPLAVSSLLAFLPIPVRSLSVVFCAPQSQNSNRCVCVEFAPPFFPTFPLVRHWSLIEILSSPLHALFRSLPFFLKIGWPPPIFLSIFSARSSPHPFLIGAQSFVPLPSLRDCALPSPLFFFNSLFLNSLFRVPSSPIPAKAYQLCFASFQ